MRERRIRPRDRADAISHLIGMWIEKHFEEFLARLLVIRQRAVRKPESRPIVAERVDDPAAVQRPDPEMTDQHANDGTRMNRRVSWKQLDPADVELRPRDEGRVRAREIALAASNRDHLLVETTATAAMLRLGGVRVVDDAYRTVR